MVLTVGEVNTITCGEACITRTAQFVNPSKIDIQVGKEPTAEDFITWVFENLITWVFQPLKLVAWLAVPCRRYETLRVTYTYQLQMPRPRAGRGRAVLALQMVVSRCAQ